MIDIINAGSSGLETYDTQIHKAANILNTQLGSLEYAQDLGIDIDYFLTESIAFQDGSFKGYLVQSLASRGINVSSIIEAMRSVETNYNIKISPEENSTGMIVR